MANFEEIALDDEVRIGSDIKDYSVKPVATHLDAYFVPELTCANRVRGISISNSSTKRELIRGKRKTYGPTSKTHVAKGPNGLDPHMSPPFTSRSNVSPLPSPVNFSQRCRSLSPIVPNLKRSSSTRSAQQKRAIWQTNRDRKTVQELEKECDEDDGDDVPDDCFLENVPISPRPPSMTSQGYMRLTSVGTERPIKWKNKPLGNGTSAQPAEQGELRSPRSCVSQRESTKILPNNHDRLKTRAKSWSSAMSDLSQETKALTKALEKYEHKNIELGSHSDRPPEKLRVKSAFAELPPLRRTEMMIDPLPISKEKGAVLSRTRPSWLPPKDPAEEKRHVKEYQRMMAHSLEVDRKKEAQKRENAKSYDETSRYLVKIWEELL